MQVSSTDPRLGCDQAAAISQPFQQNLHDKKSHDDVVRHLRQSKSIQQTPNTRTGSIGTWDLIKRFFVWGKLPQANSLKNKTGSIGTWDFIKPIKR